MSSSLENQYINPREVYFSAYDTSFVTGDSPVVHDIKTTLSKRAIDGYINNFGSGDLSFEISHDGTNYGQAMICPAGDTRSLKVFSTSKVRVTWIADTKYEVVAW